MLLKLRHQLHILSGKFLLNLDDARELDAGKRIISLLAGVYIFQKGMKIVTKSPVIAMQEILLGSFLLYNGATGINLLARINKPREIAEMRKNQIQGNDPDAVPAFV
ncbi:hypothetical protein [Pedobacter sp.]|uniref:hypothetical protein n=1 Tax=Pedobacter sp. TaxID=1411316 RepID=UPI003D7FEB6F